MEKRLNDNIYIPKEILKMTREERDAEIKKLEASAAKEKEKILQERNKRVV